MHLPKREGGFGGVAPDHPPNPFEAAAPVCFVEPMAFTFLTPNRGISFRKERGE